jgi:hypothetical protein
MIRRRRIVGVRLLPDEEAKLSLFREEHPAYTLSDIVRIALREWCERNVKDRPITVSNTRSHVKQPFPLVDLTRRKKKPVKKGRKTRQKVA